MAGPRGRSPSAPGSGPLSARMRALKAAAAGPQPAGVRATYRLGNFDFPITVTGFAGEVDGIPQFLTDAGLTVPESQLVFQSPADKARILNAPQADPGVEADAASAVESDPGQAALISSVAESTRKPPAIDPRAADAARADADSVARASDEIYADEPPAAAIEEAQLAQRTAQDMGDLEADLRRELVGAADEIGSMIGLAGLVDPRLDMLDQSRRAIQEAKAWIRRNPGEPDTNRVQRQIDFITQLTNEAQQRLDAASRPDLSRQDFDGPSDPEALRAQAIEEFRRRPGVGEGRDDIRRLAAAARQLNPREPVTADVPDAPAPGVLDSQDIQVLQLPTRPEGGGPLQSQMMTFLAREVPTDEVGGFDYVPIPAYLVQAGSQVFAQTPDGAFFRIPVVDGPVRAQRVTESEWRTGILEEMGTVDDKKLQPLSTPEDANRALGLNRDRQLMAAGRESEVFQDRLFPRQSLETLITDKDSARGLRNQRRSQFGYNLARRASQIPILRDIFQGPIRKRLENPPGVIRDQGSRPPDAMRLMASNMVTADAAEAAAADLAKALEAKRGSSSGSTEALSLQAELPSATGERRMQILDRLHEIASARMAPVGVSPETLATLIDYRASNPAEFQDMIYGLRNKIAERNAGDLLFEASQARRRGDVDWARSLRSRAESNLRGAEVDKEILAFLDNDEAVGDVLRGVLSQDPRNATYPTLRAVELLESRYQNALLPEGMYETPAGSGLDPTDPRFVQKFREVASENFMRNEPDQRSLNLPPASPYLMSFVNALRDQTKRLGMANTGFLGGLEGRSGASRNITSSKMRELASRVRELESMDPDSPEYEALEQSVQALTNSMLNEFDGLSQGESLALSGQRFAAQNPIRRRASTVDAESEGGSLDELRREAIEDGSEITDRQTDLLEAERERSGAPRRSGPDTAGFSDGFASMIGSPEIRAFYWKALNDPTSPEAKSLSQFSQRPDQLRQMLYRTYLRSGLGQTGAGRDGVTQFLSTGGIQLGDVERYFDRLAALDEEASALRAASFGPDLQADIAGRPRGGNPYSRRDRMRYDNTQKRLQEIARERAAVEEEGRLIPGLQENYDSFQAMLDEALADSAAPAPSRPRGSAGGARTWSEYIAGLKQRLADNVFPPPEPLAAPGSPDVSASVLATLDNAARGIPDKRLGLSPAQLSFQRGRQGLFTPDQAAALRAAASGAEGAVVPEGIERNVLEAIRWAQGRKAQLGESTSPQGPPVTQQGPSKGGTIQEYDDFIQEMNSVLEFVRQAPRANPDPSPFRFFEWKPDGSRRSASTSGPALPPSGPLFDLLQDPRSQSAGATRQWEDITDWQRGSGQKLPKEFVVYARPGSQAESAMEYLAGRRRATMGDLVSASEQARPVKDVQAEIQRIMQQLEPLGDDITFDTGYDDPELPTKLQQAAERLRALGPETSPISRPGRLAQPKPISHPVLGEGKRLMGGLDQRTDLNPSRENFYATRADDIMEAAKQINDLLAAQRRAAEPQPDATDVGLRGIDSFSLGDVSRLGDQLVLQAYLGGGANVVRPQGAANPGQRIFVPLSMEPQTDVMGRTSAYQFSPETGRFRRFGDAEDAEVRLRTDSEEAARIMAKSGQAPTDSSTPPAAPASPASTEEAVNRIRKMLLMGGLGAGGMALKAQMKLRRDTNTEEAPEDGPPISPAEIEAIKSHLGPTAVQLPTTPASERVRRLLPQR